MATTDLERSEQRRALDQLANAGAQPNQPTPGGHALVRPTQGLSERIVGAQPVAVYRDEQKVLQKLAALAAAAGTDWFYRFPVRTQGGGQDWIEGPSIKLANDVARVFGNNVNEVREIDVGDAWVFYARFTDIETGFSMERAYRQRKGQRSMNVKDADRQLDIAYQIGQSKAIRNCIVNALQIYSDYAFEEARNSLVDKIGKDVAAYRQRTLDGLARIPVELHRVERVIGRPAKDWLAPDIARVIAMGKAISDGMATVDETFPAPQSDAAPAPSQSAAGSPAAGEAATTRASAETRSDDAASGAGRSETNDSQHPAESSPPPAGSAPNQSNAAQAAGGGGGDASRGEMARQSAEGAPSPSFADEVRQAVDPIEVAKRRGRQGYREGKKRREVPDELRAPGRGEEALAYTEGWDLEQADDRAREGKK